MKLLLSVILLLTIVNFAYSAFVNVQRFDGDCSSNVVTDGQYIEENFCDFDTTFSCSPDGNTIFVTEYDHRGDCKGRVQNVWNVTANTCATDRHNVSMTASCVATYDIPTNALVRFDYTGQCNSTTWKNNISNVFYNAVDLCTDSQDPNNQLSFNVICNSTSLTQQIFNAPGCTGTPSMSHTFPLESRCGWFSNSITIYQIEDYTEGQVFSKIVWDYPKTLTFLKLVLKHMKSPDANSTSNKSFINAATKEFNKQYKLAKTP
ncbi:hypothetical protein ACTA71_000108 [Dictyostelium dimigraforme]